MVTTSLSRLCREVPALITPLCAPWRLVPGISPFCEPAWLMNRLHPPVQSQRGALCYIRDQKPIRGVCFQPSRRMARLSDYHERGLSEYMYSGDYLPTPTQYSLRSTRGRDPPTSDRHLPQLPWRWRNALKNWTPTDGGRLLLVVRYSGHPLCYATGKEDDRDTPNGGPISQCTWESLSPQN